MLFNRRTTFRSAALALAFVPMGLMAHSPSPAVDDAHARADINSYYQRLRQAVQARDAGTLKTLYDERFTHTHGSGKVDGRDARIVSLLAAEPTVEMNPEHELVVEVHDDHTAVVRGKGPILNTKENQLYQFRWVQTLVKGPHGWRMVVSQATRLPDAPVPNPASHPTKQP